MGALAYSTPAKAESTITCPAGMYNMLDWMTMDANYDLHTNCSQSCAVTLGLQNAINEVWGPYQLTVGGNLPANLKTLEISYRYNCNTSQICSDKEVYYVNQRYGLIQWVHSILIINGNYAQVQETVFNQLVAGVVTPYFPSF